MYAFFINRPVFASVLAILITLAGGLALPSLPIEWYPNLAQPQVVVTSFFNGASAQVVESTVTTRIEEALNGVEGMRYIESNSTNDGASTVTVTFERDRDLDLAAVDVQNRVSGITGALPLEVRVVGVTVRRASNALILGMGVYAENGEYDALFISNYIDRYLREPISRIEGVGQVVVFGERKYAMRLWVDPLALTANGLVAGDVVRALQEQNLQVAPGQIGRPPAPEGQTLQVTLTANGRFTSPEDFEDLVVRSDPNGGMVRFSDIGRVELGAESYSAGLRFNGIEAAGMGIFQLPSANALAVEQAVRQRMEELSQSFPPGLRYRISFNPTEIVSESIHEVEITLVGTIVLVLLVIFVFLQHWRTTLIPAVTIPISLIGTFAFVKLFGFSINTLTLFGLTLATGLVVDDAIVVIENIERHARERGLRRRAAALEGTREVFSAVIAMSLVLISVFVPTAFFPGTTGVLYQQFALTIAFSIALSSVTALTLAPAMAALLLKTGEHKPGGFFGPFNRGLAWMTRLYSRTLAGSLRMRWLVALLFVGLTVASVFLVQMVPRGFVPAEDQGYFITVVQAPPGTALGETSRIMERVEATMRAEPDIANTFGVRGFAFDGTASNRGTIFATFRPREERDGIEHESAAIVGRLRQSLGAIPDAVVVPFEPPPIRGVGSLGGFELRLQDRGNLGLDALQMAARQVMGAAAQRPELAGVFSSFNTGDPLLRVVLDRERSRALGVRIDEAYQTLQIMLGSAYVNDFDFLNRSYRVYVQAEPEHRATPQDIEELYVRSSSGRPVSLASLVRVEDAAAPQIIPHFNLFRSATVQGGPAPGYSSMDALLAMEEIADQLPDGIGHDWSGLALEETQAGNQAIVLFALGLLLTFLVLAAQYESFVLPVVILTAVPMGILGALGGQYLRGLSNDVFCQIGLLMLIGLASKNAILIVEFAEQLREEKGLGPVEAVVQAAAIRLRPILMTSFAFILGLLPLVLATGAGKFARHSLGTAVFSGMLVSTIVNLYFVPTFYVLVVKATLAFKRRFGSEPEHSPAPGQVAQAE